MGNFWDNWVTHDAEPSAEEQNMFNESEKDQLKVLYLELCQSENKLEFLQRFLPSVNFPQLCDNLHRQNLWEGEDVFEKFVAIFTRSSSNNMLKSLWQLLDNDPDTIVSPEDQLRRFLVVLCDFAYDNTLSMTEVAGVLDKLQASIKSHIEFHANQHGITNTITIDSVLVWANDFGPNSGKIIEAFANKSIFGGVLRPAQKMHFFKTPRLLDESAILSDADLLPFALYSTNLQGVWKRLYTSLSDGFSFNRIAHHLSGYDAPTCVIVRAANPARTVLGVYSADHWHELNRFFGSSSDFLFTMHPTMRVYRARGNTNGNFRYLNTKSYGYPHGLGCGGNLEHFRWFIPESLEGCTACANCPTFQPGKLLEENVSDENNFEIDAIEIWGCGGDELIAAGLKSQGAHREIDDENIRKARKVDKAAFFDNAFDQEFLLQKTMEHKQNFSERDL